MLNSFRTNSRLLVSIIHPFGYAACYPDGDYFALNRYSEDYQFGDTTAVMTYWHRPLQDVLNSFVEAGLRVMSVTEPAAVPETPAELLPPKGRSFICFLFFDLESSCARRPSSTSTRASG